MSEIFVKVARVGASAKDVCLNGAHTVMDALKAAEIEPKTTESFKVNGDNASGSYELEDGDRIVLVRQIEGGR